MQWLLRSYYSVLLLCPACIVANVSAWYQSCLLMLFRPSLLNKMVRWCPRTSQTKTHNWVLSFRSYTLFNTMGPRQDGRHFPDDIFKCIFLNENIRISIKISLKFVPKGPINNIPALVQIMAWRRPGDKPLSEPMMVSLMTHICVTWPQWVNFSRLL